MARFSALPAAPPRSAPWSLGISPTPVATHEAGQGFAASDPHLELFNSALSGLLADQFYESGDARVGRLVALVPQCDPAWLREFIPWLRATANLRSAPIVLAAEYARAKFPYARQVVASALQRADEPGELLGYWTSRHGRSIPQPVKRGIADALGRLYSERSLLRYDGQSKGWRFGDVIELVHPKAPEAWRSALYRHALDRRRHAAEAPPEVLGLVARVHRLETLPPDARRAMLADAAEVFSWERLAGWLPNGMDVDAWQAMVPKLGYMALLRNLNNFDRVGVEPTPVLERLTDAEEIARSRVMPFRFLTAYMNLEADTYKVALASAADMALSNLPALPGRTLIMVDCSGSMADAVGAGRSRSPLRLSQAAAFMAEALARRCDEARIVCYDSSILSDHVPARHVGVLRSAADQRYGPRGSTWTWGCTSAAWRGEDRVVIITDEQTSDADDGTVSCPVVTWNMAGYQPHHAAHGRTKRYLVSGYNDTALQVLPSIISTGGSGRWPWENV